MWQEHEPWKYCYWLDAGRFQTLQQKMAAKGVYMRRAEKNPCEALLDDVGYAAPECWSAICRFDALPFFEASPFKDKILVVSSMAVS